MIYELTIGGKTKRSTLGQHQVKVDFDALPENAKDFAIRYGLRQYLADAMAGAEDEADAKARMEARLAKLTSGDLSRAKGEGLNKPDTVETRARKLARTVLLAAMKDANAKATKEDVAAAVAAMVAEGGDKNVYKVQAKEQLDKEAGMTKAAGIDLKALGLVK